MANEFEVQISADVSQFSGAMDEASSKTEELKGHLEGIGEGAHGAEGGLEGAGEAMEVLKEHAEGLLESLTNLTGGWKGLLEVIGAGVVAELMEKIADTTMEVGDSMRQFSAVLGVSASDARGYTEAMESLGVSQNAFAQAIRRLEMDAASGGKQLDRLKISTTDLSGATKSGAQLFDESVEKINNLSNAGQRAEAANTLWGRSSKQLQGVLSELASEIEEAKAKQEANTATNELAERQSLLLHKALTDLKSAWEDGIIKMSGPVVSALKVIEAELVGLIAYCQAAATAIMAVFQAAGALGGVVGGVGKVMGAMPMPDTEGTDRYEESQKNLAAAQSDLSATTKAYGDTMAKTAKDLAGIPDSIKQAKTAADDLMRQALHRGEYSPNQGFEGEYGAKHEGEPSTWAPKAGRGGGRKKRGGGADPMAGTEDALVSSYNEMKKLDDEFAKMGSEADITAKASKESFATLKAAATQAYTEMKTAYDKWAAAVKSGDAEAAKAFQKDWKDATKEFQMDFDAAKAKAQEDMQQIKNMSQQISGEISGVLNNAISGKLNWQQEFTKILSKMLDELVKYCTQMVVKWAATEAQKNAITQAGATQALATQKTAHAASALSDAEAAAQGAWNSVSHIPIIGWILGPIAAAAAFSGVMAFGSAAGGAVIPPGTNPRLQLHENEMVLPSGISRGFQEMIRGGQYGGQGNTANINMHMQSLDPRSMHDIMYQSHDMITNVVARGLRGGILPYTG